MLPSRNQNLASKQLSDQHGLKLQPRHSAGKQSSFTSLRFSLLCSDYYRAEILSLLTDQVTLRHPAIKLLRNRLMRQIKFERWELVSFSDSIAGRSGILHPHTHTCKHKQSTGWFDLGFVVPSRRSFRQPERTRKQWTPVQPGPDCLCSASSRNLSNWV